MAVGSGTLLLRKVVYWLHWNTLFTSTLRRDFKRGKRALQASIRTGGCEASVMVLHRDTGVTGKSCRVRQGSALVRARTSRPAGATAETEVPVLPQGILWASSSVHCPRLVSPAGLQHALPHTVLRLRRRAGIVAVMREPAPPVG